MWEGEGGRLTLRRGQGVAAGVHPSVDPRATESVSGVCFAVILTAEYNLSPPALRDYGAMVDQAIFTCALEMRWSCSWSARNVPDGEQLQVWSMLVGRV